MSGDLEAVVGVAVQEVITFTRAGEKILGIGATLGFAVEQLGGLGELDPELQPELIAAIDQLSEVMETLTRAGTFVDARLRARLDRLGE